MKKKKKNLLLDGLEFRAKRKSALKYLLFLLFIVFILLLILFLNRKIGFHIDVTERTRFYLSFFYVLCYTILGGILIFFGIKNFNDYLIVYFQDDALTNLVSVSIVISISFLYAAILKNIISEIIGKDIGINEWTNVYIYIFGRFFIILVIFILLKFRIDNK